MTKKRILMISEDIPFYRAVQKRMQIADTEVMLVLPVSRALAKCINCEHSLTILDWHTMDAEEMSILSIVRDAIHTPILVIVEDTDIDTIISLYRAGATAFLRKPVDVDVCVAQADALIRLYLDNAAYCSSSFPVIAESELIINPLYRQVTFRNKPIDLTRKEFELLYFLACHPEQVLTSQQMYEHIWSDNLGAGSDETVRVHINTLRKKLGRSGKAYIQNVWGVGYKFSTLSNKLK